MSVAPECSTDIGSYLDRLDKEFRIPLGAYVERFGIGAPDSADIVQEVFVALWKKLNEKWDFSRPASYWLFNRAKWLSLKYLSSPKRRREVPLIHPMGGGLDEDKFEDPNARDPLEGITRAEMLRALERALAELDGFHRVVVEAYVDEPGITLRGLAVKVSERIGEQCTLGRVKGARQYGMKRLRTIAPKRIFC